MKPIKLKLKYKGFIFGEFKYTEKNGVLDTIQYGYNSPQLVIHCAEKLNKLMDIAYCRTEDTINEVLKLNNIISITSADITNTILYKAALSRQRITSEIEDKSSEFRQFLDELVDQEIKAYKHRVMRGKVGSMKAGLPITQKPYQAGRAML